MTHLVTAGSDRVIQHLNIFALRRNLWRHRDIIYQFTVREIQGRYKGSFLGLLWSFVHPLVLLLTYTFVFGVIFRARWPGAKSNALGAFSLVIFCGLIVFSLFAECINRAAGLIVGVPNYVKKVVFPLEILPVSLLGSALFHAAVSFGILMIAHLLFDGRVQWTTLLLPLVALPLIFLSLGLTWFVAGLGVFIRDITYTVTLVMQVLVFLTPIFYPIEAIPEPFRTIIHVNPLTSVVENFRNVILWGKVPSLWDLVLWILTTGMIMLLGYAWFMKTKRAFADVV
jgi:lipopolysaccharide transport system permease protein